MPLSYRSTKRSFVLFMVAFVAAAGWLGGLSATPAEAGPATQLNIISVIPDIRSGDVFQVQVEAVDGGGIRDTSFTASVSLDAAALGGSNFNGGTQNVN